MVEKVKPQPLVTRPTVSIVVPCYNYRDFLPHAVTSALEQRDVDLEVIIADNGSTDGSLEVARRLADTDSRIRIHTQPRNINYLRNFNDGLDMATGDYAQILSADDMLTPGSIARSAALLESRPDVVFTYGSCSTFDGRVPKMRTAVRNWSVWNGEDWIRSLYRSGRNVVRNPEVLMRTSTLRDSGGFNVQYPVAPDMLLWLRAASRGNVGRINGPDQALFRVHGANMHLRLATEGWLPDLKGRQVVFDTLPDLDPFAPISSEDILASRRALATRAARFACAAFDSRDIREQKLGIDYADYARSIWPEIEGTSVWHAVKIREDGTVPRWRTTVAVGQRKVRSSVGGAVNRHLRRW